MKKDINCFNCHFIASITTDDLVSDLILATDSLFCPGCGHHIINLQNENTPDAGDGRWEDEPENFGN